MSRFAHWPRTFATLVACAAAYALVLQVILTSALAASLPLAADQGLAWPFCQSASSSPDDAGDDAPRPKSHCALCFCRLDAAAPPPPHAVPHIERFAIERRFRAALRTALAESAPPPACQPRGPPVAA